MPVLYDADKVRTAAITKYIQVRCLKLGAQKETEKLTWKVFRTAPRNLDYVAVYKDADEKLQFDEEIQVLPQELSPDFIKRDRQFSFAHRVRQRERDPAENCPTPAKLEPELPVIGEEPGEAVQHYGVSELPQAVEGEEQGQVPEGETPYPPKIEGGEAGPALLSCTLVQPEQSFEEKIKDLHAGVHWAVTYRKVHFMPAEGSPPWCAQRKGARAKPLVRVAASGVGPKALLDLCLADQVVACEDCLKCVNDA
jgi:hypothetical protein